MEEDVMAIAVATDPDRGQEEEWEASGEESVGDGREGEAQRGDEQGKPGGGAHGAASEMGLAGNRQAQETTTAPGRTEYRRWPMPRVLVMCFAALVIACTFTTAWARVDRRPVWDSAPTESGKVATSTDPLPGGPKST